MNTWKAWLALTTLFTITGPFTLSGCAPGEAETAGDEDADEASEAVSCYPQMSVFPVGAAHNIGYDSTCNDGTCDTSCPDQHANSDWGGSHHGIDVFAFKGAPLVAVADGTIVKVGVVSSTSGLRVRMRDACGWEYYYGHLDSASVVQGQVVQAGDVIGTMGNSGTGGVHLHFNVSPDGAYSSDINPFGLLEATSATACEAPPPPPPPPPPGSLCGLLGDNGALGRGDSLTSCDGRFTLAMQHDGNLVVYQDGTPLWHTSTYGTDADTARLQNGKLRVTGPFSGQLWASSGSAAGAFLSMQDDGNLVIYRPDVTPVWSSGTCCH